jgi:hypothetical protein
VYGSRCDGMGWDGMGGRRLDCDMKRQSELIRNREYEILAIEPHEGMREELVKKHLKANVKVLHGDAENMAVETEWADAVIAAQVSPSFLSFSPTSSSHLTCSQGIPLVRNGESTGGNLSSLETRRQFRHDLEHRRL